MRVSDGKGNFLWRQHFASSFFTNLNLLKPWTCLQRINVLLFVHIKKYYKIFFFLKKNCVVHRECHQKPIPQGILPIARGPAEVWLKQLWSLFLDILGRRYFSFLSFMYLLTEASAAARSRKSFPACCESGQKPYRDLSSRL